MAAGVWFGRTFPRLLGVALLFAAAPVQAQTAPAPAAQGSAPATAGPAPNGPIPVEAFANLPFLSDARLSPDGTRIAARVSGAGIQNIGIWTLAEGASGTPQLISANGNDSFQWAGDSRLLITTSVAFGLSVGDTVYTIRIQRVESYDLQSRKRMVVGPGGGFTQDVIFVDPAGRYVLMTSQTFAQRSPNVLRVDLQNGESAEVQPPVRGVFSWFADAQGVVRAGVDYGERRTRLHYRPNAQAPLQVIETRRNLADDSVIDMVRFISDTGRGFIVTNAETGRFAIYDYDFTTDTRGAALFSHPEVDVSRGIFSDEGGLDGVMYEDDRPRVRWLNPRLEVLQQTIDRALPNKTNLMVNRSRDGNRTLVFSTAPDDPGTYYVFDNSRRRLEIFASPYESLIDRRLAPMRPLSYHSRDGLTIHGYLTVPLDRPERSLPLIVMPHGGPFVRDSWAFDPQVQFLASRGYAVLQVNFRGSTGYGRDFVSRGHGQLGSGMIADLEDGVDWLTGQGIVDRARVCIMGSSYGGYAAIWGAMRSPDRYRCVISFAGPSDLRAMVRYDRRFFTAQRYARQFEQQIEGEQGSDLNAISPVRHPELLRVPALIAHGERDVVVPVDQSRRLVRELQRANANIETIFYPKSAHGFTDAVESADFMRRVEAFLSRHNPAGIATAPPAAPAGGVSISPPSR